MIDPTVVSALITGALTTAVGVASWRTSRVKTLAEAALTRARARKAEAEADGAETVAKLDEIAGGIDRRLDDLTARLDATDARLGRIEHEVTPNHGGSMRDAVRRLEVARAEDQEAAREWRHALGHQIDSVRSLIENVDDGMRGVESRATAEHARIWTALEKPS
mgnify:FL=1